MNQRELKIVEDEDEDETQKIETEQKQNTNWGRKLCLMVGDWECYILIFTDVFYLFIFYYNCIYYYGVDYYNTECDVLQPFIYYLILY